ncbi:MAG: hypothetical protein M1379_00930 [Firmicutes bacterium]|nr:hypothetical protein [Bacillota bacterium]
MINGKRYDWEDVTIALPHGTLIDVEGIDYSDKKEVEAVYGKGTNPQGYGAGNYSAEGKLSLKREEFNRLVDYAKQNAKSLYGLPPFPISVSYANEDERLATDKLQQCKITGTSNATKQGDKSVNVEIDLTILGGINWNGLPANV